MQKKKESLCAQDPGGTSTLLTLQQKQHHLQSSLSRATLLSYKIIIILITKHACNALKSVFIAARSQWAAGWIHMKGLTLGDWTGAGEVSAGRSATEWSIHTDHSQLRRGPTGLQESTEAPFIFFLMKVACRKLLICRYRRWCNEDNEAWRWVFPSEKNKRATEY